MGLKELIGGVGLIVLFIISCLYFMTGMINLNNPDGYNDVAYLNSSIQRFTEQTDTLKTATDTAKERLESETPSPIYIFLIIYSAFTIPIAFLLFLVNGAFLSIELLFISLFGTGGTQFAVVFIVVSALVVVSIVLAVLKAIRLGQTER